MQEQNKKEQQAIESTFKDLGVCEEMLLAIDRLGYKKPTPIQKQSLPYTLKGKDIIALAETGSGKTLSFALPIIQKLLEKPTSYYAIVLSPTRELCVQIADHFKALGADIGLKTATIVGGIDLNSQVKLLNNNPHIVIGTPGKIVYHIENTKSFKLSNVRFFVMDEADKLLSMDFEKEINKILENIPQERNTFLFSATMTNKVEKLERASLRDPVKVEVSKKYQTVENLTQEYLFIPAKFKEVYLAHILSKKIGNELIIFTATCMNAIKICLLLRKLGYKAVTINGQMSQGKRLGSLARFKSKDSNILVATDVASRGLDIPEVDCVINYDLPMNAKDYVHRVGRTARAGRAGRALTFVSQYDVEEYQRIQQHIGKKLDGYKVEESEVLAMKEYVDEQTRIAVLELKGKLEKKGIAEEDDEGEGRQNKYRPHNSRNEENDKGGKKPGVNKKIDKKKFRNKKKRTIIDI